MARPGTPVGTICFVEIAGFVVALVAALAAGASALYALGANRQAAVANQRASEALELQHRIDDREREFRDVAWESSWHEATGFTLRNVGLTDAHHVTLVLHDAHDSERHDLGLVAAGQSVDVDSPRVASWMVAMREFLPLGPGYLVHWSSRLGQPSEFRTPAVALFELPED